MGYQGGDKLTPLRFFRIGYKIEKAEGARHRICAKHQTGPALFAPLVINPSLVLDKGPSYEVSLGPFYIDFRFPPEERKSPPQRMQDSPLRTSSRLQIAFPQKIGQYVSVAVELPTKLVLVKASGDADTKE